VLTRNKFNKCLKILLSNSCLCSIVIIRSFGHFVAWIEEKWITKWFNKKALEKEFMTQKYWNEKMQNYFKVWKGIIILEIFCYSYDCYKILKRKNIFGIIFYFPVKKTLPLYWLEPWNAIMSKVLYCCHLLSLKCYPYLLEDTFWQLFAINYLDGNFFTSDAVDAEFN
jgi:hypothetical protein